MSEVTVYTPTGGVFKIKKAKGSFDGLRKKIAISFDAETFEAIAMKAVTEGRSFSKQVQHYIELGRRVDTR